MTKTDSDGSAGRSPAPSPSPSPLSPAGRPAWHVEAADIEDITETIWATLFELPLERGSGPDQSSNESVTGCVQIDGAWTGAVVLQCPLSLALQLTSAIFQADHPPHIDEVLDTIGEVTNMVAGNFKGLLPEPCRISLPAVALGSRQHFSVNGTTVVATVPFACGGHTLTVRVLSSASEGGLS